MGDKINEKLNKELEMITFSSEEQVLQRLKQPSLKERLMDVLNKEITIPLVPVTTLAVIAIAIISVSSFWKNQDNHQQLTTLKTTAIVEKGGNLYWKEWFVEVKERASQNKG